MLKPLNSKSAIALTFESRNFLAPSELSSAPIPCICLDPWPEVEAAAWILDSQKFRSETNVRCFKNVRVGLNLPHLRQAVGLNPGSKVGPPRSRRCFSPDGKYFSYVLPAVQNYN